LRALDIIIKKRDALELTREEIEFFVGGLTRGEIPDYQISAWAMAVLLCGMTDRETTDMTLAMAHSGEVLDLSDVLDIVVDKHSTGGVGDKTTLVVEPAVAACGLPVGKMSGRGLGFSGGTLDKLESIPGYRTNLTRDEFRLQLKTIGIVLTGQSSDLAPADGKLYALRDVTGTVQSIPLIASSIMSKKIAAGAQAIVLDVKVGLGAFMQSLDEARRLSELMVAIGKLSDRRVVALLSDMNQPLGQAVGNALELREAIDTLHGRGPQRFLQHCLEVAGYMLVVGNKAATLEEGRELASRAIKEGRAWETFRALVSAQGGDLTAIDHPEQLPGASLVEEVLAPEDGWIAEVNARVVGETSVMLGAGREKKGDSIDLGVGILVLLKVGDKVKRGQLAFKIFSNKPDLIPPARAALLEALKISPNSTEPLPLFYGMVGV
jgi:pyrimidine-nucleoside phosphorylase